MTASTWAAPRARLSGSSRLPRNTPAPARVSAAAPSSERVRPSTRWPAAMSSATILEPIKPVAPVRKTRMETPFWLFGQRNGPTLLPVKVVTLYRYNHQQDDHGHRRHEFAGCLSARSAH